MRELGKSYGSVDEYVADRLPKSRQPNQRRRKKEWCPARRSSRREKARTHSSTTAAGRPPTLDELLRTARSTLASATEGPELDFVGVVSVRPTKGPKQAGAFKCWIASKQANGVLSAEALAAASSRLRDALWEAIPGHPDLTTVLHIKIHTRPFRLPLRVPLQT